FTIAQLIILNCVKQLALLHSASFFKIDGLHPPFHSWFDFYIRLTIGLTNVFSIKRNSFLPNCYHIHIGNKCFFLFRFFAGKNGESNYRGNCTERIFHVVKLKEDGETFKKAKGKL